MSAAGFTRRPPHFSEWEGRVCSFPPLKAACDAEGALAPPPAGARAPQRPPTALCPLVSASPQEQCSRFTKPQHPKPTAAPCPAAGGRDSGLASFCAVSCGCSPRGARKPSCGREPQGTSVLPARCSQHTRVRVPVPGGVLGATSHPLGGEARTLTHFGQQAPGQMAATGAGPPETRLGAGREPSRLNAVRLSSDRRAERRGREPRDYASSRPARPSASLCPVTAPAQEWTQAREGHSFPFPRRRRHRTDPWWPCGRCGAAPPGPACLTPCTPVHRCAEPGTCRWLPAWRWGEAFQK